MKCENCGNVHGGNYGSGRFCSIKCARGFSTKSKRKEINEKVSLKMRDSEIIKQRKIQKKHASYIRETEATSLIDLSSRTARKILERMSLGCSVCGWSEAYCDLHHIVEKKNGGSNGHNNIAYICPNCHRKIHSKIIKPEELISLEDYIGDDWKKFYYVKNGKLNTGSVPAG